MNYIEQCGLLKMDILGLRNLTIISDCLNDIKNYLNIELDISNISLNEEKVFDLINQGRPWVFFS